MVMGGCQRCAPPRFQMQLGGYGVVMGGGYVGVSALCPPRFRLQLGGPRAEALARSRRRAQEELLQPLPCTALELNPDSIYGEGETHRAPIGPPRAPIGPPRVPEGPYWSSHGTQRAPKGPPRAP